MSMKSNDPHERVNHIRCKVTSCRYHDESDCCKADMINVVAPAHGSCDDTSCATFDPLS